MAWTVFMSAFLVASSIVSVLYYGKVQYKQGLSTAQSICSDKYDSLLSSSKQHEADEDKIRIEQDLRLETLERENLYLRSIAKLPPLALDHDPSDHNLHLRSRSPAVHLGQAQTSVPTRAASK
jgi:hypothetical protein